MQVTTGPRQRNWRLSTSLKPIHANVVSRDTGTWAILAGMRFVLATIVLVGHVCQFTLHWRWPYSGTWPQMSAVYGFLLISGYCIAASLQKSPGGYFRRRILRIYPTYLAAMVLAYATAKFIGAPTAGRYTTLGSLVMLEAILSPRFPLMGQAWTLAAEWWCYMAAPLFERLKGLAWAVWAHLISASYGSHRCLFMTCQARCCSLLFGCGERVTCSMV
jgi:peptidoglycan/LPS O-acetylase OafA/YrhL